MHVIVHPGGISHLEETETVGQHVERIHSRRGQTNITGWIPVCRSTITRSKSNTFRAETCW